MESANTEYTVVINGKPQGPYRLEELKALHIEIDTFVRKPGMDDYKEAQEFSELRSLFGFNYQQTIPQYFASFDQRLMACVIDYFLILTIYVIFILICFIFVVEQTQRIALALVGTPLLPIVKFFYGSVTEASEKQAGLGKRLMDIRVADLKGNRISLSKAYGRNLAKLLSVAPFFFGYLYSFLNKKLQCFHDVLSDTLVIKDRLV